MKIEMNYQMMADMRKEFQQGIEDLNDTLRTAQQISQRLESEGLKGLAGRALCNGIDTVLTAKLNDLSKKFQEMIDDLNKAEEAMRSADSNVEKSMGV